VDTGIFKRNFYHCVVRAVVDVDIDLMQAVVPLCPTLKYSTIHLQYKIKFLIQRFTTTSSSVQQCCEIINNILVVPRLI